MPMFVLIGSGSGDYLVHVPQEPVVGSTIKIDGWTIVKVLSGKRYLEVGRSYLVTKRNERVNTGTKKYGKLPLFSLSGPIPAKPVRYDHSLARMVNKVKHTKGG